MPLLPDWLMDPQRQQQSFGGLLGGGAPMQGQQTMQGIGPLEAPNTLPIGAV